MRLFSFTSKIFKYSLPSGKKKTWSQGSKQTHSSSSAIEQSLDGKRQGPPACFFLISWASRNPLFAGQRKYMYTKTGRAPENTGRQERATRWIHDARHEKSGSTEEQVWKPKENRKHDRKEDRRKKEKTESQCEKFPEAHEKKTGAKKDEKLVRTLKTYWHFFVGLICFRTFSIYRSLLFCVKKKEDTFNFERKGRGCSSRKIYRLFCTVSAKVK